MQITKPTLAVLHIWLHHITALAHFAVAEVTLSQLLRHECSRSTTGDHFAAESGLQVVEQFFVAADEAGFENGGQNGVIGSGKPDALVDAARRVPDFLPRVPQAIENELDDALHEGRLLVG